jgi:hypothetical protein
MLRERSKGQDASNSQNKASLSERNLAKGGLACNVVG